MYIVTEICPNCILLDMDESPIICMIFGLKEKSEIWNQKHQQPQSGNQKKFKIALILYIWRVF
jgi:hypothetical protein